MTLVTLVVGGKATDRERAIAGAAGAGLSNTAIVEGLPTGEAALEQLTTGFDLDVFRIAAGCPCCSGNLTIRVTLNRALKRRPNRLFLSLSNSAHKEKVRHFLQEPPYLALLELSTDINCD
jgi:G3E family GTPase